MKLLLLDDRPGDVFAFFARFGRAYCIGRDQHDVFKVEATDTGDEWIVSLLYTIKDREWETKEHRAVWRVRRDGEFLSVTIPKPTSKRMREFVQTWVTEAKRAW